MLVGCWLLFAAKEHVQKLRTDFPFSSPLKLQHKYDKCYD